VGTWTAESSLGELHGSTTFIFNSDGTGYAYASMNDIITNKPQGFTYQLNNNQITLVLKDGPKTAEYNLIDSNTLILDKYIFYRK